MILDCCGAVTPLDHSSPVANTHKCLRPQRYTRTLVSLWYKSGPRHHCLRCDHLSVLLFPMQWILRQGSIDELVKLYATACRNSWAHLTRMQTCIRMMYLSSNEKRSWHLERVGVLWRTEKKKGSYYGARLSKPPRQTERCDGRINHARSLRYLLTGHW